MKTEVFYKNYLQKYFDKRFKKYEDSIEYFVDPAPNQWKFAIPELSMIVLLVCDDKGKVRRREL